MGHNPRYRSWGWQAWKDYAPTLGHMVDDRWRLTSRCQTCGVELVVDVTALLRKKGRTWSPWGQEAPCRVVQCQGRMRLVARNGRAEGPFSL